MGIGNITSKLATSAKEVAKTFKETSAPKIKKAVEQKVKVAAEIAQDAYGRAAVKFSKETDAEKIKKITIGAVDMADDVAQKIPMAKAETVAIDKLTGKVIRYDEMGQEIAEKITKIDKGDGVRRYWNQWGEEMGEVGRNTTFSNYKSYANDLAKETIEQADGKLYRSADKIVNEAKNGAQVVINAMGEKNGENAGQAAIAFIYNGKTAIEKQLDDSEQTANKLLEQAKRKVALQEKYGDKIAEAKAKAADKQFKEEALAKLKELSE